MKPNRLRCFVGTFITESKCHQKVFVSSICFNLFFCFFSGAQDLKYAGTVVDTLASRSMHGRGYVNGGEKIAAKYIENEFDSMKLLRFQGDFRQEFKFPVNTFPGRIQVILNDKALSPGRDFLIGPGTSTVKGTYKIIWLNKAILDNAKSFNKFNKKNFSGKIIIIDDKDITDKEQLIFIQSILLNPFKAGGIVVLKDKLTWRTSQECFDFATIEILRDKVPAGIRKISLDIESKFIPDYSSQNIIAFLKGEMFPDSFIVFSSHYDHLGQMGADTYFPGANDNASGTAMLLNLAKYYSKTKNKPRYSMAFMAFGAEEIGLVGSKYYTENPLFPLSNIKILINMDILGTGEEGITVVNATKHSNDFSDMLMINSKNKYLKEIKSRGEAANSDHFFFSKNGVKSFFIYSLGGIKAYHDLDDKPETLPLTEFKNIFLLLTDFTKYLQN